MAAGVYCSYRRVLRYSDISAHLLNRLLIVLSSISTVVIRNSYRSNGRDIRGKIACWNSHVLKHPGSPDLSILFNHFVMFLIVCWIAAVSFKLLSKVLLRLLSGFSFSVGISSPAILNRTFSETLPLGPGFYWF